MCLFRKIIAHMVEGHVAQAVEVQVLSSALTGHRVIVSLKPCVSKEPILISTTFLENDWTHSLSASF